MKGLLTQPSENVNLLYVHIVNTLKFEKQVKGLSKKVNQKASAFGRSKPFLGPQKSKILLNSKAQSPVRKKSPKCEKVRAKYVLGMRSDLLLGFLAKNFSAQESFYVTLTLTLTSRE